MDHNRLRATFDEAPELYDRVRPEYPPALFDDLVELAGIARGGRVLEIGPGTGQATLPLAQRGCEIVAVELGPDMAAVARRKLDRFPSVTVVVSAFEDWPLLPEPFDAVISATAFHWVDPAVRTAKVADVLRPGGGLAIIGTHHIAGGDERFFAEVQRCYERWDPAAPTGLRLPRSEELPVGHEELKSSGRFGPVVTRRYEREVEYTTRQYLDLLLTYSGHRSLPDEVRGNLLSCIAQLMDTSYGGRIVKRYLFELAVTHLREG